MPVVEVSGVAIYYELGGEGDWVLLVHHGLGCTKMWEQVGPELRKNYRVLAYDRRGFGQSEAGEGFEQYYRTDHDYNASVKELAGLIEKLGIEQCSIVGQCEGGAIALKYAAQHPGRVKAVVVSNTLCFGERTIVELLHTKFPASFAELAEEVQEELIAWHGKHRAEELYRLFRGGGGPYGRGRFDMRSILPDVACPVLILYGDRSHLFPVEQGVAMYRLLPRGELVVLPNCGHHTYAQRPYEYVHAVLSFLGRHPQ